MAETGLVARIVPHRDAALDTRERLLGTLLDAPGRVVLSTCHRVEVYETTDQIEPVSEMRTLVGRDAAAHLLRVAAGLDSAIAGERQILTQERTAYDAATGLRATRLPPMLGRLFERALHVGREIRRRTRLGDVHRSIGSLAVDDALPTLGDPASAPCLVTAAGGR